MPRIWFGGNILMGAGSIVSFIYILFAVFWTNPHLIPWYPVFLLLIFISFNYFFIPKYNTAYWIASLVIMISSAVLTYTIHILVRTL